MPQTFTVVAVNAMGLSEVRALASSSGVLCSSFFFSVLLLLLVALQPSAPSEAVVPSPFVEGLHAVAFAGLLSLVDRIIAGVASFAGASDALSGFQFSTVVEMMLGGAIVVVTALLA